MRLLLNTLQLLTTLVVLGQPSYQIIDLQGDDYIDNCIEVSGEKTIYCIGARNLYASSGKASYLVEIDSNFSIDTTMIPWLSPPNKLFSGISDTSLYFIGADGTKDSNLAIVKRTAAGQFSLVNSIQLPGQLRWLSQVKSIYGKIYILGNTISGPANNEVFLIELDSMSDSTPKHLDFTMPHTFITIAFDITPYQKSDFLLSFFSYPDSIPYAYNHFVLSDTGLVNHNGRFVDHLFGYTLFLRKEGNLYYTGRYSVLDTINLTVNDEILIGIVDTITDSTTALSFTYFGKDSTVEAEAANNLSAKGDFLFVGGTTNVPPSFFVPQDADFAVAKYDLNLNQIWVKYIGLSEKNDELWTVLATSDGGCLLAGTTYDYINSPVQERDILIYKLDADGNVVTGVPKAPGAGIALQVYPNPTSSTLVIDPDQNQTGTFHLINTVGQKTGTWDIHDRTTLSVEHLPTGIYFYHFVTREGENTSGQVVIAR